MSNLVEVQYACDIGGLPDKEKFDTWTEEARTCCLTGTVVVRLVDRNESASLNMTYRKHQGPTNVLSFPFEIPPGVDINHLGDLVICAPVVIDEAASQGKSSLSHWAHMIVHGMLHLQGYDHGTDEEAKAMEALECVIMNKLGYHSPYSQNANPIPTV